MFLSVPVRSSAWAWLTPKAATSAIPKICNCFMFELPTWITGRNACTNRAGIECDFWRPNAPSPDQPSRQPLLRTGMSNHSSALPSEVATREFRLPRDTTSVASAYAEIAILASSPLFPDLAQVPEQSCHDAKRLFGNIEQDVLVRCMLRAPRIGMRDPDRR